MAGEISVPVVPKYQADEVAAINAQADRDRAAYQDAVNQLTVSLHLPSRYAVSGPVLMSTIDPADKKRESEGIIEITVDQRKRVRELYATIAGNVALQKLLDLPADVKCPADADGAAGAFFLHFCVLFALSGPAVFSGCCPGGRL